MDRSFDELAAWISTGEALRTLTFATPAAAVDFLHFVVAQYPVILHASRQSELTVLEPRRPENSKSGMAAVFGSRSPLHACWLFPVRELGYHSTHSFHYAVRIFGISHELRRVSVEERLLEEFAALTVTFYICPAQPFTKSLTKSRRASLLSFGLIEDRFMQEHYAQVPVTPLAKVTVPLSAFAVTQHRSGDSRRLTLLKSLFRSPRPPR